MHHANVLVSTVLKVIELEPKAHYFVVEVGTWLYEFYVQVFWRFSRCGSGD